jgi:hypothetical protein
MLPRGEPDPTDRNNSVPAIRGHSSHEQRSSRTRTAHASALALLPILPLFWGRNPAAFDILTQECEIDTPVRVARQDESPRISTLSNMVRNISSNQARHRVNLSPKMFPLPILAVRFSQSDELSLRGVLRKVNRFRYPVLREGHTLSTTGATSQDGLLGYFSSAPGFAHHGCPPVPLRR